MVIQFDQVYMYMSIWLNSGSSLINHRFLGMYRNEIHFKSRYFLSWIKSYINLHVKFNNLSEELGVPIKLRWCRTPSWWRLLLKTHWSHSGRESRIATRVNNRSHACQSAFCMIQYSLLFLHETPDERAGKEEPENDHRSISPHRERRKLSSNSTISSKDFPRYAKLPAYTLGVWHITGVPCLKTRRSVTSNLRGIRYTPHN